MDLPEYTLTLTHAELERVCHELKKGVYNDVAMVLKKIVDQVSLQSFQAEQKALQQQADATLGVIGFTDAAPPGVADAAQ